MREKALCDKEGVKYRVHFFKIHVLIMLYANDLYCFRLSMKFTCCSFMNHLSQFGLEKESRTIGLRNR